MIHDFGDYNIEDSEIGLTGVRKTGGKDIKRPNKENIEKNNSNENKMKFNKIKFKNIPPNIIKKESNENISSTPSNEDKKGENKKPQEFKAFKGKGFLVSYVNTQDLKVDKNVTSKVDRRKPICKINIRLFNGEVVCEDFNLTQTVQDIKNFVSKKSGSEKFILLEGFPPKPLEDVNKTIKELNLAGSTLTQRIK